VYFRSQNGLTESKQCSWWRWWWRRRRRWW